MKMLFITTFLLSNNPIYGVQNGYQNEKKAYCNKWSHRFLSLKDGKNYSAEKFSMYVKICKDHYVELRNYYKKLSDSIE